MSGTTFKLARGLVFAILCASLSPAFAEGPIFNVNGELDLEDTRLELAVHPPPQFRIAVSKELAKIRKNWAKAAPNCLNPATAPANLVTTKAYLQSILKKLSAASGIESRLQNSYGVCVTVTEESGGMFSFLSAGPRLNLGIIEVPAKFLLEFTAEDELAFVLAHELSHFLLKHEIFFAYIKGTNHSLDELQVISEREADELAMRLIVNAGYSLDMALVHMKQLRSKDPTHFVGSQLEDMRNIIMTDIEMTGKTYTPVPSAPYLPGGVLGEINAYLHPQSAAAATGG